MAAQRPAVPGELCSCGRPAIVMFLTDDFGPVAWCGMSDAGAKSAPQDRSEAEPALPLAHVSIEVVDAIEIAEILKFSAQLAVPDPDHAGTLLTSSYLDAPKNWPQILTGW